MPPASTLSTADRRKRAGDKLIWGVFVEFMLVESAQDPPCAVSFLGLDRFFHAGRVMFSFSRFSK
jgi:hypothetical protein